MDWLPEVSALQKELVREWSGCERCPIGVWASEKVHLDLLPGSTNVQTERLPLLLVGEAPGESEDVIGKPFIGRSGHLLRDALDLVVQRSSYRLPIVFCNVVACRPCDGPNTKNRPPTDSEVATCRPRLLRIFQVLKPRVVVMLGKTAYKSVYENYAIDRAHEFHLIPTMHPAFVLRKSEGLQSKAGADFLTALARAYDLAEEYVETYALSHPNH